MGNDANVSKRDGFRSRGGFIIACIGSAVGMGNIWRFPTLVSKWGGMTFLLPYFLFVILIGSTGVIGSSRSGRAAGAWDRSMLSHVHRGALGQAPSRRTGRLYSGARLSGAGHWLHLRHGLDLQYTFLAFDGGLSAMRQDMDAIVGSFNATASAWGANVCRRRGRGELCHHVVWHRGRH